VQLSSDTITFTILLTELNAVIISITNGSLPQEKLYSTLTSPAIFSYSASGARSLLITKVKTVFLEYILYPVRPKDR